MRKRLWHGFLAMVIIVQLTAVGWTPPDSPLADAAMRGDVAAVKTLIDDGADLNAATGDGMTALHWAAERNRTAIAELLLAAGASVSVTTRLGNYTPLHIAARNGSLDVVAELLDAGADPNAPTSTGGATPLHLGATAADGAIVALLMEHGARVNQTESRWGQTPLMFAASAGRLDPVDALLRAGADLDARSKVLDMEGQAVADRAASERREQVLKEFQGDRVAGGEGWTPSADQVQAAIMEARASSESSGSSATTEPEEEGYDSSYPSLVGAQGGLTPLLHAVREGHEEVALRLLDAGADIDQASGGDHTSPLLMAAMNGHFDLMIELLERGADPTIASDARVTPLFAAINSRWPPKARYPQQQAYLQQEASHYEVMRKLLAAGADPNVRLSKHLWFMEYTFSQLGIDMRGATPLWRAAHALDVQAVRMLAQAGADPHIPTQKPEPRRRYADARDHSDRIDPSGLPPVAPGGPGVYPIHAATGHGYGTGYAGNSHHHARGGWLPTLQYLVEELGADVNRRDHDGYTPLHNAAARGDVEMLRYLVEHGADPMAVSRRGETTVDLANGPVQRVQPFPEAIEYLESLGAVNNHNCLSC